MLDITNHQRNENQTTMRYQSFTPIRMTFMKKGRWSQRIGHDLTTEQPQQ